MANSYIEYNQNLSETTYSVPFNFLSIDDVNVKGYNGTTWSDLTVSERDAVAKTVKLSGAPSAFQKIRVWRNTGTTQLVDFQNGSRLSESDLDTAYQQGLFVAQEVSENASTEVEGIGPQGPQGIQGVAGNDGADGADGVSTTVALSESFESSEITIASGNTEVTHGLGSIPKIFQGVVRCVVTEHGYSVGDEVDYGYPAGYNTCVHHASSTKCGITLPNTQIYILPKVPSNTTPVLCDVTKWKIVLRAFA